MDKTTTRVVPINGKDLSRILEIEQNSFVCPWTSEEIARMYRSQELTGVSVEVAKNQSFCFLHSKARNRYETVGFLFFYRRGEDTIEIWTMAIDPRFRRQGYGTALIEHIKRKLILGNRRKKICVSVHETNLYAQLFLRSCGFLCEEIVEFQYSDSNTKLLVLTDVYIMVYRKPFVPHNRLHFRGYVDASDV